MENASETLFLFSTPVCGEFVNSTFMSLGRRSQGRSLGVCLSAWKFLPASHLFIGLPGASFGGFHCSSILWGEGLLLWALGAKSWIWGIDREVQGLSWNGEFRLTPRIGRGRLGGWLE